MKKYWRFLLVLALAIGFGACANAQETGYATDSYASQIAYDSFNYSVRKRMDSARIGAFTRNFAVAPSLASGDAYAMAPSSRTASVSGSSRRQLDCVYYNGFNVWGDFYQTWAKQRTKDGSDGYRYRATAPAVGFDWSTGGFTIGIATTYNWGKIKSLDDSNDRDVRTWAVEAYAQYDAQKWYVNGTLGYANNRFDSDRWTFAGENGDRYHSNAWNADGEFGMKFGWNAFKIVPHIGLRYFHDNRGDINEGGSGLFDFVHANSENYHVLELPIGVNLSYEINAGGMVFVPQIRGAWIPELSRKRGGVDGYRWDAINGWANNFSENAPKRAHNGFMVGAGLEARITKSLSAHIDYNLNWRNREYEHHWNLGVGFTF